MWRLILVPPEPGARPRQLSISAAAVRVAAIAALLMLASIGTWAGQSSRAASVASDRLAESQATVVSLLDSVQVLAAVAARAPLMPPRDMIMPVVGRISSRFSNSRLHPMLEVWRAHRGVDVAAPAGTPIVAPARGRVRFVGRRVGYGLTVEVAHSGGVITRYAHCARTLVKTGEEVQAGQQLATVGSTGLATGPHVHFEVLKEGKSVDPLKFLATSREPLPVGGENDPR